MPRIKPVSREELKEILSDELLQLWESLLSVVQSLYDLDQEWHSGGKAARYELKFRRGGKTLVSFFPRGDTIGCMVIFGKNERKLFEGDESRFSLSVRETYHGSKTYHDGKWMMFDLPNDDVFRDLSKLLAIKRKPNRTK